MRKLLSVKSGALRPMRKSGASLQAPTSSVLDWICQKYVASGTGPL
jgi:hypothetical protein